ncbi:unnamed protein product [Bursaphelenchus okinawaensis]|uniref:Uncharacterized protein n=1 Tax=Bursaphelenchus okinawaensis TaxID=465554 RepID=A0A811L9H1_9BILA|nr:unnamed protein product [Bursaphelenchus okinawaensis]CAG9118839.1 unnamed protein product [Bursaphelenchus okinawaensis]
MCFKLKGRCFRKAEDLVEEYKLSFMTDGATEGAEVRLSREIFYIIVQRKENKPSSCIFNNPQGCKCQFVAQMKAYEKISRVITFDHDYNGSTDERFESTIHNMKRFMKYRPDFEGYILFTGPGINPDIRRQGNPSDEVQREFLKTFAEFTEFFGGKVALLFLLCGSRDRRVTPQVLLDVLPQVDAAGHRREAGRRVPNGRLEAVSSGNLANQVDRSPNPNLYFNVRQGT